MSKSQSRRWWGTIAVAVSVAVFGVHAADPPEFVPDARFKGSSLDGWHAMGPADWQASNGEIIGRGQAGSGGWLVMDRSFQDLQFFASVRCEGPCRAGVLLRGERTADGGLRGIFVSLSDGDLVSYRLELGADGSEVSRSRIGPAPAPDSGAARAEASSLTPDAWNPVTINLWEDNLRSWPGALRSLADEQTTSYGAVALFVGAGSEVHYEDIAWKDVNSVVLPAEELSSRFSVHRISEMYYGWSAVSSDVNRDGAMDIISGPFYYLGPSFTERKIYRVGRVYNPATEYAPDMVNFTHDFTGDGWPDILASDWDRQAGTRPVDLYVNPRGESRRWDHSTVLPTPNTESVLLRDIDGDGQPDMVFGSTDGYAWAKPDPADPTAPWPVHLIDGSGERSPVHGLGGVGDVDGDGRMDVVVIDGWYQQPEGGAATTPWVFHPQRFGTASTEMGVYDVNGDGLTDVVSSLSVHGWGLAWFEQQRADDGTRTFVRHDIAGDYSTTNAGDVVFSEAHAARFADMNADGVPDFIVGKRYWSHLESYRGPDPYGPASIYVYRTVRNPLAPGGAEFVPELVHNRSGVGSAFEVADINQDGRPDIAVANAYGTHVFLSK